MTPLCHNGWRVAAPFARCRPGLGLPAERKTFTAHRACVRPQYRRRAGVSDRQWENFVAREVAPRFPEGFTVIDATGRWRDRTSHRLVRERSKLVMVIAPDLPQVHERVGAITAACERVFASRRSP
jgi:hypothetical protein